MYDKEAEFWRTKIPNPMDRSYYHALGEVIPTSVHNSNNGGRFLDADSACQKKREPYGFLTWKGMDQMYHTGRRIARRYGGDGSDSSSTSFLEEWNVKAYSTNYLRTVMSAQCFVDGLIFSSFDSDQTTHSYEQLPVEQFKTNRPSKDDTFHNNEPIIQVRNRNKDTLNAFDKNPELMKRLVSDVVSTMEFINRDTKAGCLAARLANFLPGLANATSYGGPSNINWIHAADHFICRSSHNVPYSKFSSLSTLTNHDDDYKNADEQTLAAMSYGVLSHLAWRFRIWYQSPPLLAAIAGPPLKEVMEQIKEMDPEMGTEIETESIEKKPFVIYSCHDVTVLSLLYGIGADFLSSDEELNDLGLHPGNDERWRFWPRYASTLMFELVRVEEDGASSPSKFVRILFNGKEIKPISMIQKKKDVLSVSDFKEIIEKLMSKGEKGMDTDGDENDDEERDMSNWTG